MNEKLLQNLSIISIFFLICSIIKFTIYYLLFNVNINEYIDLTEFTVLFINDIFLYCILIVSPLSFILIAIGINWLKNRFQIEFLRTRILFGVLSILACISIVAYFRDFIENYSLIKVNLLAIVYFIIIVIVNFNVLKVKKALFSVTLLFIFISGFIDPFVEVEQLKKNESTVEIEMIFVDNKSVKTSQKEILIGRTKNFIFLYNKENNNTLVYKNDDILSYHIQPKDKL